MEYRYLLIHDKDSNIIYGECIEWKTGEFDKKYPKDRQNFNSGITAISFSSQSRLDTIDENEKTIKIIVDDKICKLQYSDRFLEFITKRNDEILFSPLTGMCSDIEFFAAQSLTREERFKWFINNESVSERINVLYGIDFKSNSQLINTFSIYTPSRILTNVKFADKDTIKNGEKPKEMIVSVLDEFNEYQSAEIIINIYLGKEVKLTRNLLISQKQTKINLDFFPDSIELTCIYDGKKRYEQKSTFFQRLSIQGDVVTGSIKLPNGSTQELVDRMDLVIGESHE